MKKEIFFFLFIFLSFNSYSYTFFDSLVTQTNISNIKNSTQNFTNVNYKLYGNNVLSSTGTNMYLLSDYGSSTGFANTGNDLLNYGNYNRQYMQTLNTQIGLNSVMLELPNTYELTQGSKICLFWNDTGTGAQGGMYMILRNTDMTEGKVFNFGHHTCKSATYNTTMNLLGNYELRSLMDCEQMDLEFCVNQGTPNNQYCWSNTTSREWCTNDLWNITSRQDILVNFDILSLSTIEFVLSNNNQGVWTYYANLNISNSSVVNSTMGNYSFNIVPDTLCINDSTGLAIADLDITSDESYTNYYAFKISTSWENNYNYVTDFADFYQNGCICSDFKYSSNFISNLSFYCSDHFNMRDQSIEPYWNGYDCVGTLKTKFYPWESGFKHYIIKPSYPIISDSLTQINFKFPYNQTNLTITPIDSNGKSLGSVTFSYYGNLTINAPFLYYSNTYNNSDEDFNEIAFIIRHNQTTKATNYEFSFFQANTSLVSASSHFETTWKNLDGLKFSSNIVSTDWWNPVLWDLLNAEFHSYNFNFTPEWNTTKPTSYTFNSSHLGTTSLSLFVTNNLFYPSVLYNFTDSIRILDSSYLICQYPSENQSVIPNIQDDINDYFEILDFHDKITLIFYLFLFICIILFSIFFRDVSIGLVLSGFTFGFFSLWFGIDTQMTVTAFSVMTLGVASILVKII